MTSIYGYFDTDPEDVPDEEVAGALARIESDLDEAREWKNAYGDEVNRMEDAKRALMDRLEELEARDG